MMKCHKCGCDVPAFKCGGAFYPCVTFCHAHSRGIRARQVPGYPVDILTCGTCNERTAVHRGQRLPCQSCRPPRVKPARWREDSSTGFEHVAKASHNLLSPGGRARNDSTFWVRHKACGRIVPRWQRGHDGKTGKAAPPWCRYCKGERWQPTRAIPHHVRDLLYLVEFQHRGRRFIKVGRSLPTQDRLVEWIRLGARVLQVVEARHDKVQDAEQAIIKECSAFRVDGHDFGGHFTTKETFRPGARSVIGDLTQRIGRGGRDQTDEWREAAKLRRTGRGSTGTRRL